MVIVEYESHFRDIFKKIKDNSFQIKIKKQIQKIIKNPKVGKPMRYGRKGTRELYVSPFRISYLYIEHENKIVFSDIYHKKKQ
ncbi:MAG: type II toxin-antitoxin system RelE/ParE family toxin [Thaumarchaeota archaeon]|nr:type II toxin-antitoxin system RelE/ParE family toxin [Nitrososphaerota archaeon]